MLAGPLILLAAVLLLASLLAHQAALFVAALVFLLAAGTSWLWGRFCLRGVEYSRRLSESRVFHGETVHVAVQIVNRKPLPLTWLHVADEFPAALSLLRGQLGACHVPRRAYLESLLGLSWYERVTRRYPVRASARGYYAFGPASLRSGDLFGFLAKEIVLPQVDYLLVYPRVVPLTALGLPARHFLGNLRTRQQIFEDPARTVGVRPYAYGDSVRRVHWKATARAQELQVKVYEPTTTHELIVFLNVNTFAHYWQGIMPVIPDLLEVVIVVAASLANWADEEGYQVGLIANAPVRQSEGAIRLLPSRDPAQLTHILEHLALVVPFLTTPIEDVLRAESAALPWGATLLVVTAVVTEEMEGALLALKSAGHPIALVLVGEEAARLQPSGLLTYRVGGEEFWRELQRVELA